MDTEEVAAASAQSMEQLEVEGGAQVTIPCAHVTHKNARKISVVHGFAGRILARRPVPRVVSAAAPADALGVRAARGGADSALRGRRRVRYCAGRPHIDRC